MRVRLPRCEEAENQIRILGSAGPSLSRLQLGDTTLSHAPLGQTLHGMAHVGQTRLHGRCW